MSRRKEKLKKEFIERLEKVPIVSVVCEQMNLPRATVYRWFESDKEFYDKKEAALWIGREAGNDLCESQLLRKIQAGNLDAIKFWLRNNCKRYMNKRSIEPEKIYGNSNETINVIKFIGDINDGEPDLPVIYSRNEDGEVEFDSYEEFEKAEKLRKITK